jgi:membrane protein YqaA with SNARE-associated domain
VFGLPPFLLTCVAAGALDISYRTFVAVGLSGRIVRFTAIALLASIAS